MAKISEILGGVGSGLDADLVRGGEPVQYVGGTILRYDNTIIKSQCTAWVNFDGTDGTIRDSFNISTVTRTDTGHYDIEFEIEMDNANYSWAGQFSGTPDHAIALCDVDGTNNQHTDKFSIRTYDNGDVDRNIVTIIVFGGKN
jgi:hypothetical protein